MVFLAMCAAFFSIPLYVIVVTSFKTMDQIALGEIFSLPHDLDARSLVEGLGHVCSGMSCMASRAASSTRWRSCSPA